MKSEEQKIIEYLTDKCFTNSVIGSLQLPTSSAIGDPYAMRNFSVTVASVMAEYIKTRTQPQQEAIELVESSLQSLDNMITTYPQGGRESNLHENWTSTRNNLFKLRSLLKEAWPEQQEANDVKMVYLEVAHNVASWLMLKTNLEVEKIVQLSSYITDGAKPIEIVIEENIRSEQQEPAEQIASALSGLLNKELVVGECEGVTTIKTNLKGEKCERINN
jgi:hypothetical protein